MKELRFDNTPIFGEEEIEPVAFTITGTRSGGPGMDRVQAHERFMCMLRQPAGAVQLLLQPRIPMHSYIRLCLQPDEENRWDALMVDKDFNVNVEVVRQVFQALVDHYSSRPTEASTDSGPGRDSIEEPSTVDGD